MKKAVRLVFSFVFIALTSLVLVACDSNKNNNTKEKITTNTNTTKSSSSDLDPSNSYTVTYLSEVENINMNVFWNEFKDDELLPTEHPLTSGDRVLKDEPICAEITNNSDKDALAIIFIDGVVSDFKKVEKGKTQSTNFYNRKLDGDMIIKVEEYKEHNISYTTLTNTTVKVYNYEDTSDIKEISNGGKITKYSRYRVEITNNKDKRILAKITLGNNEYLKTVNAGDSYETDVMYIENDLNVETLEITGYTVTTNIDSSISVDDGEDGFIVYSIYYDEFDENSVIMDEDNTIIPAGMAIHMSVFNLYQTPLTITVTYGDVTKTFSVPYNEGGKLVPEDQSEIIIPTGNVTINITK